jgi:cell division protein ZapA
MADVRLMIAGREYIVTCKDGEEARLHALGKLVDEKAHEAGGSAGGLNESRLLLFASLLLADQVYDSSANAAKSGGLDSDETEQLTRTVERLADKLEKLVEGLEQSA